jgi:large subunit ribosomal protein L30
MADKTIQVTLVRSRYHRLKDQRGTLKGMGLTRMHKTVTLKDTPEIRGMIRKVSHLVQVVEG